MSRVGRLATIAKRPKADKIRKVDLPGVNYRPNIGSRSRAFGGTGLSRQVAASGRGTCTRGLRTTRPQRVETPAVLASSPRVRLRSRTNTQGLPSHRLTILPSLNASMHAPGGKSTSTEVRMAPLSNQRFAAYVGID